MILVTEPSKALELVAVLVPAVIVDLNRRQAKLLTFRSWSALGIWNALPWDRVKKIIILYLHKRLLPLKSAFELKQTLFADGDFCLLNSFKENEYYLQF